MSDGLFATPRFRAFWLGTLVSVVGDQFSVVGMAWLVLRLTGNASALGAVLAVGAAPKGLFILFGGAITDRFEPARNLMWTRGIAIALLVVLSVLVITGGVTTPAVFVISALLGTAFAAGMPAGSAILPQLLRPEQLLAGNGLMMGTIQLGQVIGPVAAGVIIAILSHLSGAAGGWSDLGIGICFLIDAASFAFSIVMLKRLNLGPPAAQARTSGILGQVKAGFTHLWGDRPLRYFTLYGALVNFLVLGPVTVGLPFFATRTLGGTSLTYGGLASCYGLGALMGAFSTFKLPRPPGFRLGPLLLGCDVAIGSILLLVARSRFAAQAAILIFVMGTIGGYVMTSVFSWIQARVPRQLMGRIISIVMFSTVGLMPISMSAAGVLIAHWSVPEIFTGAALCMMTVAGLSLVNPHIRGMGVQVATAPLKGSI